MFWNYWRDQSSTRAKLHCQSWHLCSTTKLFQICLLSFTISMSTYFQKNVTHGTTRLSLLPPMVLYLCPCSDSLLLTENNCSESQRPTIRKVAIYKRRLQWLCRHQAVRLAFGELALACLQWGSATTPGTGTKALPSFPAAFLLQYTPQSPQSLPDKTVSPVSLTGPLQTQAELLVL